MQEMEVFEFAKRMTDSVVCLRDAGHHLQAIMLIYAGIDQMSWLSIPQAKSSGADFKSWVDKFMLSKNPMSCTSEELWAARNGLLHMATAESELHARKPGIRQIYYSVGAGQALASSASKVVYVKSEDLITGYLTGVLWFMEDLKSNQAQLAIAIQKLDQTIAFKPLNASAATPAAS